MTEAKLVDDKEVKKKLLTALYREMLRLKIRAQRASAKAQDAAGELDEVLLEYKIDNGFAIDKPLNTDTWEP